MKMWHLLCEQIAKAQCSKKYVNPLEFLYQESLVQNYEQLPLLFLGDPEMKFSYFHRSLLKE